MGIDLPMGDRPWRTGDINFGEKIYFNKAVKKSGIAFFILAEKWRCDMSVSYKKLFHLLIEKI